MRTHASLAAAAALFIGFAGGARAQTTFDIDPAHSAAQFAVRHLMVSTVRGDFSRVRGAIVYDPNNIGATTIEATIDAATINTREPKRDAHLKSADFFDIEKYPSIAFKSVRVWGSPGAIHVAGDLTMRGVTKPVTLAVEGPSEQKDAQGNVVRIGASVTTKINRKDWGFVWNRALEAGGLTVGEEVSITIDLEAAKRRTAPAAN